MPGRGLQGGRARGAQAVQLSQLQLLVPDCMPRTQATMMALTRMLLLLLSGSPGQLWCCAAAKPSIIHIVADGERSSERSRDTLPVAVPVMSTVHAAVTVPSRAPARQ